MHTSTCIHTCTYMLCTYPHTYTRSHAYTHVHTCTCSHAYTYYTHYTHAHVHMHTRMYTHAIHTPHMHMFTCIHAHTHVLYTLHNAHVHMHACMYTHAIHTTCMHMFTCIHACTHMLYTCTCSHAYTHVHTCYTHTTHMHVFTYIHTCTHMLYAQPPPAAPISSAGLMADARDPRIPEPQASPQGRSGHWGVANWGDVPTGATGLGAVCLLSTLSECFVKTSASCASREGVAETPAAAGKADMDPHGSQLHMEQEGQEGSPGEAASASTANRNQTPYFPGGDQKG